MSGTMREPAGAPSQALRGNGCQQLPAGPAARPRQRRRLPRMALSGLRLVWQAGRRYLLVTLTLQVLQGAGVFALLLATRSLLSGVIAKSQGLAASGLVLQLGIFVVANSLIVGAQALTRNQNALLSEVTTWYIKSSILRVTSVASLDAFDNSDFHNRLQRSVDSSNTRPVQLVQSLIGTFSALISIIAASTAVFTIQPIVGLITLAAVIPLWLASIKGGEHLFKFVSLRTPADRERTYLFNLLTTRDPAKEIRAHGAGDYLMQRWERATRDRFDSLQKTLRRRLRSSLTGSLMSGVVLVAALLVLFLLSSSGTMTLAETATTAAALVLLAQRLSDATNSANLLFEASPLVDDLNEFLALEDRAKEDSSGKAAPQEFSEIRADHLCFAYPGAERLALTDISIRIKAGEVVALVGENGSGKTTLAKLLCRLYLPASGQVTVNGKDISEFEADGFRSIVAVLFQDFLRYLLPASTNIMLGRHQRGEAPGPIHEAAQRAGADVFLRNLPKGYDTFLGPEFDGADLSIGQWQRVALARAFFRDSPFIILDEPTAALDARAEYELFASIRSLYQGRTVLLISHRFSTVRTADRIYVLDKGRIIEEGRHEELVARNGLYAELFRLQADSYVEASGLLNGQHQRTAAAGAEPEPSQHAGGDRPGDQQR